MYKIWLAFRKDVSLILWFPGLWQKLLSASSLQPSISVHGSRILWNSKHPGSEFFYGPFSTEPINMPSTALILGLLNSWRELITAQKVFLLRLQKLYFSWICSDNILQFHLPPQTGRSRSGECSCHIWSHRQQPMPEPSYFPSFGLVKSSTESAQGEQVKWLQPLAGVKEFWGCSPQCVWEQGKLPIAPRCCQVHFFEFTESATPFMAWMCPKFMLPEQHVVSLLHLLACSIHGYFYT